MRLHSIRLVNYRCFRDLSVDFKPGFNVIAGTNGSGKTSLLKGICELLSDFDTASVAYPRDPSGEARLEVTEHGKRLSFDPQYPVEISAKGFSESLEVNWTLRRKFAEADWKSMPDASHHIRHAITNPLVGNTVLPVLGFYRASRHWHGPGATEIQAATTREGRRDGYTNWWDASTDGAALQRWVIAKFLERVHFVSEIDHEHQLPADDELKLVSTAVQDGLEGCKRLSYDLKQKSVFVEWQSPTNRFTLFENLSDGQKAMIGLIADIARRMCLLNPHLGQDVIKSSPGVVLIDELDLHLHPQWQRTIVRGLKSAFPQVQFIATSHSPQILGELKPGEIVLLSQDSIDHPAVSYGLDSSTVLEEVMEAESRSSAVEAIIRDVFAALEGKDLSIARLKIAELRELAPGLPELTRADAVLKRKEVIGR